MKKHQGSCKRGKKKEKLRRQRKLSLHQLRKERHIGSKSRESPSPEDERGVNVDQDLQEEAISQHMTAKLKR
eukprot:1160534-Pelagomonas_calceolata.AAC.27